MKKSPSPVLNFFSKNRATIILVGIILLALLFRFYRLSTLPPGLHPDEAANGLDIFRILQNHDWRIIYNTNGPREALFFYFQALFVWLIGNSILALRIAPALFGVGAVVMVYLYTKDWFGRRAALAAAFLMAVNPWVNTVSRDGFRASMVPLMIASVAYLAGRAYKTNKTTYFVLAALMFALGFYTYTAFALLGLVVFGGLIYLGIARRDWLKLNTRNLLISGAVFLVAIAPLAITIVRDPGSSTARAGGTSFLNHDLNGGNPALTLLESTGKTLLQYSYQGDQNSRHNLPGEPLVNVFVSIMLLLGLLVAFSRIARVKYAAVLAVFFVMMLPAILTAEGLPHALRSIGTAATLFTLAGIGIDYLLSRWYQTFPHNGPARSVGVISIGILLGLTAIVGWRQYFVAWAQDPQTYIAYNESVVAIGNFLIANPAKQEGTNFFVGDNYESLPAQYLAHDKSIFTVISTSALQSQPLSTRKVLFVFVAGDESQKTIEILQAKYPSGQLTPHYSSFNGKLMFYSYQVNQ